MFLNTDEGKLLVASVINELGLVGLSNQQQERFANLFESLVDAEMKIVLASNLSEENLQKLEEFGENSDPEQVATFLNDELKIDLFALLTSCMDKVKNELLGDVQYIRGMIDAQTSESA